MVNQKYDTNLNGCGNAVGGAGASAPAGGQHPAPLSSFAKETMLRLALAPKSPTTKKQRIMHLWAKGIITAGDVERLFDKYELSAA